ncbi:MAG: hypothetical protein LBF26_01485 [Puniceicoccales bacterium]|nr:hypothetical protein [Puniceicoccales bacterium]
MLADGVSRSSGLVKRVVSGSEVCAPVREPTAPPGLTVRGGSGKGCWFVWQYVRACLRDGLAFFASVWRGFGVLSSLFFAEGVRGQGCVRCAESARGEPSADFDQHPKGNALDLMLRSFLGRSEWERICAIFGSELQLGGCVDRLAILRALYALEPDRREQVVRATVERCCREDPSKHSKGSGLGLFVASMFQVDGVEQYKDIIFELSSQQRVCYEANKDKFIAECNAKSCVLSEAEQDLANAMEEARLASARPSAPPPPLELPSPPGLHGILKPEMSARK